MRYHILVLFVMLIVWHCEAKKRRKNSMQILENRRTRTGSRNKEENEIHRNSVSVRNQLLQQGENNRQASKARQQQNRSKFNTDVSINDDRDSNVELDERRKEVLRSTMRHMFGFEHMNAPRVPKQNSIAAQNLEEISTSAPPRRSMPRSVTNSLRKKNPGKRRYLPDPPDFMLELYRSYSEDQSLMLINSISQGNTVRSFFSVAGESPDRLRDKGKPMIILPYFKGRKSAETSAPENGDHAASRNQMRVFAFNVNSIPATETIVAAELRLNGLRNLAGRNEVYNLATNASGSSWSAVIAVYRVSNPRNKENRTRNVYQRLGDFVTIHPNSSFSWVDRSIANLASRARRPNRVLIVKLDDGSEDQLMRRKRDVSRSKLHETQLTSLELPSFFVIISDRAKRNSGNRRPAPLKQLSPLLIVYCNDTTSDIVPIPDVQEYEGTQLLSALEKRNVSSRHRRARRSANQRNRESSLLPPSEEDNNEFPGESPRPLSDIADNDQTELHDNRRSERQVIQSLKDRNTISQKRKNKKRKRGRKCRKRGRKGKKSRRCKKEKNSSTESPSLNQVQNICSRKSLHVDFEDMGWAYWIISPKSFDSYYCSGQCKFETMKQANPSNHAIVQSFVNAFGINTEVPAPCCVPDKLLSLSVLFFDENENVVLKVFPNMSVESCACR